MILPLSRMIGRYGTAAHSTGDYRFELIAFTVGCGPTMKTTYKYSLPYSAQGLDCTHSCKKRLADCRAKEDIRSLECKKRQREDSDVCKYQLRVEQGTSPRWYACSERDCISNYDRCESSFRSCFEDCGGDVTPVTEYIANCEQVPRGAQSK
jgi:hypothetical protein